MYELSTNSKLNNTRQSATLIMHVRNHKEYPLADLTPVIASLGSENFTELFGCLCKGLKWSMLILAPVSNSTPACEKDIQIFCCVAHNLFKWTKWD